MEKPMLIGEAARATGISAKMIRHYEQAGLLPSVHRAGSGYRVYGDNDLHRLHFIRRSPDIPPKTTRHYDQSGLFPSVQRAGSAYRAYGDTDLHRLHFIRSARDLGFSLAEIRSLLDLWDDQSRHSADVKALAQKHIEDLEARIARMRDMAGTLKTLVRACAGDSRPDCPILKGLQSHSDHR